MPFRTYLDAWGLGLPHAGDAEDNTPTDGAR